MHGQHAINITLVCPVLDAERRSQRVAHLSRSQRVAHLNRDPLDLIERDLIAGAIIELRGARAFMRRHRLCILQSPPASKYVVMPVALNVQPIRTRPRSAARRWTMRQAGSSQNLPERAR